MKMGKKIFYAFFVFLLTLSLASAATYHGTLSVGAGGSGQIIIGSGGCQEDWSSSGWSSCADGTQIFICFDKNNCGTTSLKPASCGNSQACTIIQEQTPPSTGGGGGGGGGGSPTNNNLVATSSSTSEGTCVENWQCSQWSNLDKECGTRSCTDLNKCGTSQLKPETSKKCPSIGLFGITGGAIGAIGEFVTSGEGILTFLVIIGVTVVVVLFFVLRRGRFAKKPEAEAVKLNLEAK
jgi:hypothetical protein